jgi:hypothetical protein
VFFEVEIFVGIRARNRSRELIAVLSKNTSARYPSKKIFLFCHVISIAIKEHVFL